VASLAPLPVGPSKDCAAPAVSRYLLPRLSEYVEEDLVDGVARHVGGQEGAKKVPQPHSRISLYDLLGNPIQQLAEALADPKVCDT
jgi:hypothetical protein